MDRLELRRVIESPGDFLELFDAANSIDEDRFIAIGLSTRGVLVVIWTERDEGVTRIISARPATRREILAVHGRLEELT